MTSRAQTQAPSSSLRPRNRRLISGLDEELESDVNSGLSTRIASPRASPFASRPNSPIPSKHPSRAASSAVTGSPSRLTELGARESRASSGSFSGLWGSSWTVLAGLATSVLGGEGGGESPTRRQKRRQLDSAHSRVSNSAPPAQWGPPTSSSQQVGLGTQEEREALVKERKRRALMDASQDLLPDTVGNFKRRNSDDQGTLGALPTEQDLTDALVYLHVISKSDTLAGISIKYNCPVAVIRKSNRMWPNDTVQTRKSIVLPVDACGVKGRPVPAPIEEPEEDLLLGGTEIISSETTPGATNTTSHQANGIHNRESSLSSISTSVFRPQSSTTSQTDAEPPWKHDSWSLLPSDTKPTEIVRLPRQALGFFPRARRKSLPYSDEPTPSPSIDLTRPPSVGAQSPRASLTLLRTRPSRSVSSASNTSNARTNSAFLQGPGGVGTMGRNVRAPGPAQDGLNKHFAQYLPSVAPPPNQSVYTPWNPGLYEGTNSAVSTPGVANAQGFEFEQIPGAIEGWMRKVATKAATALQEGAQAGASKGAGAKALGVGSGMGDLIELTDAFAIGEEEEADLSSALIPEAQPDSLVGLPGTEGVRERNKGRRDDKED